MVDDLTRRIQSKFNLSGGSAPELDQDLKEVTTSSLEAYRFYAEGINLHNRYKEEEAVPLFEKAVEIDPDFAMALAKLSIIHGNLNDPKKREEYGRRALEHVNRLTARERYYIEGLYYSDKPLEVGRANQAYRKALELYPDHSSARHNLALNYLLLGRYDEAVEHYEELRRRGMTFPSTYGQLAAIYGARAQLEKGREVLDDFIRRYPDNAQIHRALGNYLVNAGRPDEALIAYQKAASLEPGNPALQQALWQVAVLKEEWREADATAQKLLASSEPFRRWQGAVDLAKVRLYQGRSKEALELLRRAAGAYPEPSRQTADAYLDAARVLLERGDFVRALEEANLASRDGKEDWGEWWAHLPAALAQAKLGRWQEAGQRAAQFKRLVDSLDAPSWKVDYQQLVGELALLRGDAGQAVTELRSAEALLTPEGWAAPFSSRQVPLWFSLGSAYLEAGQEEEALERFRRVAQTTGAHVHHPIPYVRSFYFLGRIHEKRGEKEKAREHYQRFLKYWRDGDLDRERVIEALDKTS
jgi:tetratricopeptide (TPR) repeat protein